MGAGVVPAPPPGCLHRPGSNGQLPSTTDAWARRGNPCAEAAAKAVGPPSPPAPSMLTRHHGHRPHPFGMSLSGPLRDTAATVECCIGDGSCARDRRPSRPRPGRPPPGRRRPAVLGAGPGTQHRQRGLGVVLLGPRSALARHGAVAQTRPADVITRDLGPRERAGPTGRCGCSGTTPPLAARPAHAGRAATGTDLVCPLAAPQGQAFPRPRCSSARRLCLSQDAAGSRLGA
jgi:hypothetical protein